MVSPGNHKWKPKRANLNYLEYEHLRIKLIDLSWTGSFRYNFTVSRNVKFSVSKFKRVHPRTGVKQVVKSTKSKRRNRINQKPMMPVTVVAKIQNNASNIPIAWYLTCKSVLFFLRGADNEQMVIVIGGKISHLSSNYNVVASQVQNRRGHTSKRKSSRFELFPCTAEQPQRLCVNCWEALPVQWCQW